MCKCTGEDGSLWDLCTKVDVLLRIFQKIDKLHNLDLGLFASSNVSTMQTRLIIIIIIESFGQFNIWQVCVQ